MLPMTMRPYAASLAKLDLAEPDDDHRRVLAVVTFLEAR
jgi:hypothetical protein